MHPFISCNVDVMLAWKWFLHPSTKTAHFYFEGGKGRVREEGLSGFSGDRSPSPAGREGWLGGGGGLPVQTEQAFFSISNLMSIISAPPIQTIFLISVLAHQDKCPLWFLLQVPEGSDLAFCSRACPAAVGRVSPDMSCSVDHP